MRSKVTSYKTQLDEARVDLREERRRSAALEKELRDFYFQNVDVVTRPKPHSGAATKSKPGSVRRPPFRYPVKKESTVLSGKKN